MLRLVDRLPDGCTSAIAAHGSGKCWRTCGFPEVQLMVKVGA